jgi:hypothetical protein
MPRGVDNFRAYRRSRKRQQAPSRRTLLAVAFAALHFLCGALAARLTPTYENNPRMAQFALKFNF